MKHFTFRQLSRSDGYFSRALRQQCIGCCRLVKTQSCLLFGLVRSMAGKAFIREDGLYMLVVIHWCVDLPVFSCHVCRQLWHIILLWGKNEQAGNQWDDIFQHHIIFLLNQVF